MKTSELIFLTVTAITLIAMVPADSFANGEDPPPPPTNIQAFLDSQGVGKKDPSDLLKGKDLYNMATITCSVDNVHVETTEDKEGPLGTDRLLWKKIVQDTSNCNTNTAR